MYSEIHKILLRSCLIDSSMCFFHYFCEHMYLPYPLQYILWHCLLLKFAEISWNKKMNCNDLILQIMQLWKKLKKYWIRWVEVLFKSFSILWYTSIYTEQPWPLVKLSMHALSTMHQFAYGLTSEDYDNSKWLLHIVNYIGQESIHPTNTNNSEI